MSFRPTEGGWHLIICLLFICTISFPDPADGNRPAASQQLAVGNANPNAAGAPDGPYAIGGKSPNDTDN